MFFSIHYLLTIGGMLLIFSEIKVSHQYSAIPAVKFQNDGIPSTNSYIIANTTFPIMKQFSVCTHLKVLHSRGKSFPIISYAAGDFDNEIYLTFDVSLGTFEFMCCKGEGRYNSRSLKSSDSMLTWVHLCVTVNLPQREISFYVNEYVETGILKNLGPSELFVMGGGTFILGQEQDDILSGFSMSQSFEGYFAGYAFADRGVDQITISSFLNCQQGPLEGSLASFVDLTTRWTIVGSTAVYSFSASEICNENTISFISFPERRTYSSALSLCHLLKGRVIVPESPEENEEITNATEYLKPLCNTDYGIYMWLGMAASNISGSYDMVNVETKKPILYKNYRPGYSQLHGEYKCAYFDVFKSGMWSIYPCDTSTCVTCSFKSLTTLRLRGLCRDTRIDRTYMINGYFELKPKFEGVGHSKIIYLNNSWILTDAVTEGIQGYMNMTEPDLYPFGLRRWSIIGDDCVDKTPLLLLTACNSSQFTCNDGTCIPKMQRCDLQVQCPDQSDERLCTTVVVPSDYIKEVPPARVGQDPASISIQITILSMYPIDTLNMKAKIEIIIILKWRDPRVDLESLNYAETMNVVHNGDEIWRPYCVLEDASGSETTNHLNWETFAAVLESLPLEDDITRFKEDEVYPGRSNSLKLVQSYSVEFFCRMNLVAYPFDTQYCSLVIRLQDIPSDFVVLEAMDEGVKFVGNRTLREYEVKSTKMARYDSRNFSGHMITISLDNLSGFYLFSTYVPTMLMVIICYSTYFFDINDFNDRIMVSITALLVLATLFTQVTQTTPKTAYLKLLDVWFVSCILINFVIVVGHVFVNHVKIVDALKDPSVSAVISYKKPYIMQDKLKRARKYNRYAQILLPIGTIMFVLGYIIVTLTYIL